MKSIFEGQYNILMGWSGNNEGREPHYPIPVAPVKYKGHILEHKPRAFSWRREWLPMVRAVVSESENGVPFPASLLSPSVHQGESLPSIVLSSFVKCRTFFFHLLSRKTEKTKRKRNLHQAPNLSKQVRTGLKQSPGCMTTWGFDTLCSWHQKSMERT